MPASLDDLLTTQQQGVVALGNLAQYLAAIPGILTPLSPANGGTGVANGALSTITLGGAVTYSGAFTTTFTVTANTSVTLPTTGTLATLAGAESLSNKTITGPSVTMTGTVAAYSGTAIPAGGTTGSGIKVSSTANFGVFFGSGAPTLSAAKGSLYLRSDGTTTNDRAYINTDGGTTWTAIITAA